MKVKKASTRKRKARPKCPHGKRKAQCKECGGSAFCEHGKEKRQCKKCGDSVFCEHGAWKTTCKECNNFTQSFCGDAKFAGLKCLLKHMRAFHRAYPKARTKQKELIIHTLLANASIQFDCQVHVPFKAYIRLLCT